MKRRKYYQDHSTKLPLPWYPKHTKHWATRETQNILEWVAYTFSSRSSQTRNWTRVFCIVGEFFTSWVTRKACYKTLEERKLKSNIPDEYWCKNSQQDINKQNQAIYKRIIHHDQVRLIQEYKDGPIPTLINVIQHINKRNDQKLHDINRT